MMDREYYESGDVPWLEEDHSPFGASLANENAMNGRGPQAGDEGKGGTYGDDSGVSAQDTGLNEGGTDHEGPASSDDKLGGKGTSETSRERQPGFGMGDTRNTPPTPRSPQPANGSVQQSGGAEVAPRGVVPFNPLPPIGGNASGPVGSRGASSSRLFGMLGGLQGGGIGSPSTVFNPNDPGHQDIGQLMALLKQRKGLF